jgi:hypothetical protein
LVNVLNRLSDEDRAAFKRSRLHSDEQALNKFFAALKQVQDSPRHGLSEEKLAALHLKFLRALAEKELTNSGMSKAGSGILSSTLAEYFSKP